MFARGDRIVNLRHFAGATDLANAPLGLSTLLVDNLSKTFG